MFGLKKRNSHNSRPKNVRARDGLVRLTSGERRRRSKISGLSKKQLGRVTKERRAYKSGKAAYRGRLF